MSALEEGRRASPGPEPVVGWRIWRLRGTALHAWVTHVAWAPGDNAASCLASGGRCDHPPGRNCQCGFWALSSPLQALERARREPGERGPVLGLMRGWGEIAVHGAEGFRAEHATVACLFSDWVWGAEHTPFSRPGRVRSALWRLRRRWGLLPSVPPPNRELGVTLPRVAEAYGVPLLGLRDAVRLGVLGELGVGGAMIEEARRWIELASAPGGAPGGDRAPA